MADKELLKQLKRGVASWNQWRQQYRLCPDLTDADLAGLDLAGIDLSYANLENAELRGCNLALASLDVANLVAAKLDAANLSAVQCYHTNFWEADMRRCNLSLASFEGAIFKKTVLTSANFSHACFSDLLIVQVDFSTVTGLATVLHKGPSAIDLPSVILPLDEPTRLLFLRGCGFSDAFIEALPTVEMEAPRCILSYVNEDETLARRIHEDLQAHGVRCWLMPHDQHFTRMQGGGLGPHEKLILLLSEHAVKSSWASFEVRVAFAKELAEVCSVLFPLRVDEAVMQAEQDWATRLRESRPIGDFSNFQDDAAYQQAFTILLQSITECF